MEYGKKQFRIRGILLAVSVIFVAFLWAAEPAFFSRAGSVNQAAVHAESGIPGLHFTFDYADNTPVELMLWYRENDAYLFLPAGADTRDMIWVLNGAEDLRIDGSQIAEGDAFALSEGVYPYSVTAQRNTTEGSLYVVMSANVNSVFIQTASDDLAWLHESKEHADTGMMLVMSPDAQMTYNGGIERIKCRGEASFEETDKKSYAVKLTQKTDLLGSGKAKQYTLISNYFDGSYLKNYAAYHMARSLAVPFAVNCEYADLYLNGFYAGNYLLTDKVEIGSSRIAIRDLEEVSEAYNRALTDAAGEIFPQGEDSRLKEIKAYPQRRDPDDISGGYLLELEFRERYDKRGSGFITAANQPVAIIYPAEASLNQASYIANLYQEMEDATFSPDGNNPVTGKHYSEYLDINSFARHYLVEEITKNMDAASSSRFFFKPEDAVSTKLFAGPNWDFDRSMRIPDITPDGYNMSFAGEVFVGGERDVEGFVDDSLWHRLYMQEDFFEHAVNIYLENGYTTACMTAEALMPQTSSRISKAVALDGMRRNKISGGDYFADSEAALTPFYTECIATSAFLRERAEYLKLEWEGKRE